MGWYGLVWIGIERYEVVCPDQDFRTRYFDPHSPCKMTDFGAYLAPIWRGRILGPKSGHLQAVSGLFWVTPDFVIVEAICGKIPMS